MASIGSSSRQINACRSGRARRCAVPLPCAPSTAPSRSRSGLVLRAEASAKPTYTTAQYEKANIGDALPEEYMSFMPSGSGKRRAGVILHPTSLPGPYGIGDLGQEARNFVDWLADAGMQVDGVDAHVKGRGGHAAEYPLVLIPTANQ